MARGSKICPKCKTSNGPRTYICKNTSCGHNFRPGQVRKSQPIVNKGVGKGKKQCPDCKVLTGPRTFRCPSCNYNFKPGQEKKQSSYVPISRRVKRGEILIEDWQLLELGATIRVLKNSGSYYKNGEGEKIYMYDPGIYTVKGIDKSGLKVYGKTGFGYVYMGQSGVRGIVDSITKEPCNIALVKGK